ncbi:MAG: lipid asymmetry maintenance ABC transporter permease subunit MlaE [Gammaproteobacteria bacterium]
MVAATLQSIGGWALGLFENLGRASIFLGKIIASIPHALTRPRLIIKEIYSIGVLSLTIILVSGLFVGMVLGLQGYITLVDFGAEESLGVVVAMTLVRELGPVVTALLFAGRAGSALAAEIGLMKATEQLSSMEMMAVDPIKRIITPRFIGGFVSVPILTAIFTAVGILGGRFVGVGLLGIDEGSYWSQMQANVDLVDDVANGMIKGVVFAVACVWIALYKGYEAMPTAEGISLATTHTVVNSALAVLALDFVLTALMFGNL